MYHKLKPWRWTWRHEDYTLLVNHLKMEDQTMAATWHDTANLTRELYEAGQIDAALAVYKSNPAAVQPNVSRVEFIEGMERLLAIRNQNRRDEIAHSKHLPGRRTPKIVCVVCGDNVPDYEYLVCETCIAERKAVGGV